MENKNYFQGNKHHPCHISVGAVVRNEKGEIMVHHFIRDDLPGYWPDLGINDFYILMRETLLPNETLESALHRGLMEEFGVTAKMLDYIGSLQSHYETFVEGGGEIEKTVLYFLCEFVFQDESKRDTGDIEGKTNIEWHTIDFLIPKMQEQAVKYNRTDVDESPILDKIKN